MFLRRLNILLLYVIFMYSRTEAYQTKELEDITLNPSCRSLDTNCLVYLEDKGRKSFSGAISTPTFQNYNFKMIGLQTLKSKMFDSFFSKGYCVSIFASRRIRKEEISEQTPNEELPPYDYETCCDDLLNGDDIFDRSIQAASFDTQYSGSQQYITENGQDYLVPGHLMPSFLLNPSPLAKIAAKTCYNMVPVFHSVYYGNWHKTFDIMKSKIYAGYEYHVRIQRVGTLNLPGLLNTGAHMYARKEKGRVTTAIPIPDYLVLYFRDGYYETETAFVTFNNPFMTKDEATSRSDLMCTSGKSLETWDNSDMRKGYSFSCSLKYFKYVNVGATVGI